VFAIFIVFPLIICVTACGSVLGPMWFISAIVDEKGDLIKALDKLSKWMRKYDFWCT
jgi:hypothetical protein